MITSSDDSKQLVQRYIDAVWNRKGSPLPFFAPHYQRYVTAGSAALTGEEQAARIMAFHAAFPDINFALHDLFAEGDHVVFRATMHGTHLQTFRGIAPTGGRIAISVLDIVRVEDGLFVEHWGGPDLYDLFTQIGVEIGFQVPGIRGTARGIVTL